MSQWGKTRVFTGEGASITALCDVDTIAFDQVDKGSKIWWVGVLDAHGDEAEIVRLSAEARGYVGKPYSEWLR
jgi:hypothetical protein